MNRFLLLALIPLALALWIAQTGDESQSYADSPLVPPTGYSPAVSPGPPRPATQEPPDSDAYCLTCHSNRYLTSGFADGRTFSLYVDARAVRDSAHGLQTCVTCHEENRVCPPDRDAPLEFAAYRSRASETCSTCHLAAAQDYAKSAHWQPVFNEGEGVTCYECHSQESSGHTVARTSDASSTLGPARIDGACGRCHEEAAATYDQTSHGKVARFGDAGTTAICTTCHSDHDVRAVDDPAEPLTAARLAPICADCHRGSDESFAAAWPGHSEGASGSAAGYMERIGFFWTAGIVGFGLVHVSLDLLRRRADRNRRPM